ncbi:MAG: class I SAM-dependent methyltransferase [Gemmatimonadota bacterium]
MTVDRSNGWDDIADEFIVDSPLFPFGVDIIRSWSAGIDHGSSVVDIGCGPGGERSGVLNDGRFLVYALDASRRLAASYAQRHPEARVTCEAAEESRFFDLKFDAAMCWGLIFLLDEAGQEQLIQRVASALRTGGRFLLTAPVETGTWKDLCTGRESRSLGDDRYREALDASGFSIIAEYVDAGENHYYSAVVSERG